MVHVLVVEDDPSQARFLSHVLEQDGYDVQVAATGDAGARALEERAWDALITDIELPGVSGLELVRRARDHHPGLVIVVVTAHATVDRAAEALRADADDFWSKPLLPRAVVADLGALLTKRAQSLPARHVLAIGAHPDDVEIGVGGVLLAHRSDGDDVSILTLSSGSRGGETSQRAIEAHRAASMLGARLSIGGLTDTQIPESDPTVGLIEDAIGECRPDVVYTHSEHDVHQDHRNVHRATLVAARSVDVVYGYQSPSATVEFRPARFAAIDDQLEGKLAMIAAYSSQAARAYLDPELLRATARYWGSFGGTRFCEPLEVFRERSGAHRLADRILEPAGDHAAA